MVDLHELHTRILIKARNNSDSDSNTWEYIWGFGIPYEPDKSVAEKHPKVVEALADVRKKYSEVVYEFVDV